MPKARHEGVVVQDLGDETLIYDVDSHKAHCLNRSAAAVWRSSDGATDLPEIGRRLGDQGLPADDAVVWMALARLERAGLLTEPLRPPGEGARFSRRQVVRMLGMTAGLAVALPAVTSITAPLAAQTASCIPRTQCGAARPPNCTGLPTCENRNRCCVQQGGGRRARCRQRPC